jgi:hypothetical protein
MTAENTKNQKPGTTFESKVMANQLSYSYTAGQVIEKFLWWLGSRYSFFGCTGKFIEHKTTK